MRRQPEDGISDRNPLAGGDAAKLADAIIDSFGGDSGDVARLVPLCHAFTYERDLAGRENMMRAVEHAAAPLLSAFDAMLNAELRRTLDALRKGGGA